MVVYRFGPFEFDPASGRLYCGQQRVPLSDAQAAILLQLITHAGDFVSRATLIHAAWRNAQISENSLAVAISRLRQALGCGRDGTTYIETRNTLGFRFVVPVERAYRVDPGSPTTSLDAEIARFRAFAQGRADIDSLELQGIHRARTALDQFVRDTPDFAPARVALAIACGLAFEATALDEHPDTASLALGLTHARTACALPHVSGEALSTLAYVSHLSGQNDAAAAAAHKAAELDRENVRHLLLLGYVLWGDARLRAARRLQALVPGLALTHWLAATVFIARGAFPAAIEEVRLGCVAQDLHPKQAGFAGVGLHLFDALIHAAHGRLDEAVAALMRELAFAGSGQLYVRECMANTWYALGAIRLRQGQPDEARQAFARALAVAPGHVCAAVALRGEIPASATMVNAAIGRSILLVGAGRHAEAARVYGDAIAQAPPGSAGWLLPVEPMLNVAAHREVWAEALALVRLRAM